MAPVASCIELFLQHKMLLAPHIHNHIPFHYCNTTVHHHSHHHYDMSHYNHMVHLYSEDTLDGSMWVVVNEVNINYLVMQHWILKFL